MQMLANNRVHAWIAMVKWQKKLMKKGKKVYYYYIDLLKGFKKVQYMERKKKVKKDR